VNYLIKITHELWQFMILMTYEFTQFNIWLVIIKSYSYRGTDIIMLL